MLLALLCMVLRESEDGFVVNSSTQVGSYSVQKQLALSSSFQRERVIVYDADGKEVWRNAGTTEAVTADYYLAPDFDCDGVPEVMVVDRNYDATGWSARVCVYSLGQTARNLLVFFTESWGRLKDADFDTTVIDGIPILLCEANDFYYWLTARGGAPYPVAFAFRNDRMRVVTSEHPEVAQDYLSRIDSNFDGDRRTRPRNFDEFCMYAFGAMTEFVTRTSYQEPEQILRDIRARWSVPVSDFVAANADTLLVRHKRITYAAPYLPVPWLESQRPVNQRPIYPPSMESIRAGDTGRKMIR